MEGHEFKHVCKFCPKSFSCGRSLGGHMRSHMNNSSETDEKFNKKKLEPHMNGGCILRPKKTWPRLSLCNDKICKDKEDSWSSGFRSKTKRRRTSYKVVPANPSSMSYMEQEQQQEVALSLLMLSRNAMNSIITESCDNSLKNLECGDFKREFHCASCKKIFHSHQALGGHRASRKRISGGCTETDATKLVDEASMATDIVAEEKVHECPICLKVFSSGQALGGHKRSHLLNDAKQNQRLVIQKPTVHEFLDLNMPAPVDDETGVGMGFNQWWARAAESNHSHKHKALVAFISN